MIRIGFGRGEANRVLQWAADMRLLLTPKKNSPGREAGAKFLKNGA